MTPDRKQIVNGRKVEEFYWNGGYVVYIDNKLYEGTFAEAVESVS